MRGWMFVCASANRSKLQPLLLDSYLRASMSNRFTVDTYGPLYKSSVWGYRLRSEAVEKSLNIDTDTDVLPVEYTRDEPPKKLRSDSIVRYILWEGGKMGIPVSKHPRAVSRVFHPFDGITLS